LREWFKIVKTFLVFAVAVLAAAFWSGCQSNRIPDRPSSPLFTVGTGKDGKLAPRDKFTVGETVQMYLDGYPDRDAVLEISRNGKLVKSKRFRVPSAEAIRQRPGAVLYDELGSIRRPTGRDFGTVAECSIPIFGLPEGAYEAVLKINDAVVANSGFTVSPR
jgi:hypothetical protein